MEELKTEIKKVRIAAKVKFGIILMNFGVKLIENDPIAKQTFTAVMTDAIIESIKENTDGNDKHTA